MDDADQYRRRPEVCPLPPGKADDIPVEILSEIFLLIVQDWSGYRRVLMLVCRRWHDIILSTPGIHSRLTIRRATQEEVVQAFIQGRKSRLYVRIDMNDEKDGSDFNAGNLHACLRAAARAANRWSSLHLISPPPHGEYKALQILQPLVYLESLKLACGFGEFVEPLMTAISRSASPNLTTVHLEESVGVLYLVQPTCLHINHSLTTLRIQLSKRMDNPVDILPHLHRLKVFEARRLYLPIYPPGASLPLTGTLRILILRSVSIQWMSGQIFPALERCSIVFPHHADIAQALRPVSLPSCSLFLYHANDLHPLARFHLPSLHKLGVNSGHWSVWRGSPQLAALRPVVVAGAQSLTELRLDVECSEQLLAYMLSLVPALKHLLLGLARPNTLSATFFRAFIVREPNADGTSDMIGSPTQAIAPLCPSLKSLYLHYKRWLRGPDKKALIGAFGDILASRNPKIHGSFDLMLNIDEALDSLRSRFYEVFDTRWSIEKSVRNSPYTGSAELLLGISTPRGIIPISKALPSNVLIPLPFKEAEYLRLRHFAFTFSIEFFFAHDHVELMIYDYERPPPRPRALQLFDTLRVLVVEGANPSFLAGRTFHKLERCRVVKSSNNFGASPSSFPETKMPVCIRVDIDDPYLLSTFKLPQICELALNFSHPDCSTIWKEHFAVNMSGLTLLHMKDWPFDGDLISILGSLPFLETLIISCWKRVLSFRAFLPMDTNGTAELEQMIGEGRPLALLCPRLRRVRIEGQDPLMAPELVPILKMVVTRRAECGSPLKSFTFSHVRSKPGCTFELIGRDVSFALENLVLDEGADEETDEVPYEVCKIFELDM